MGVRLLFDDTWLYIHDPDVKVGRVQNYKSWSPALVPDPATTCLGMEYFCFRHDGLWSMSDDALIAMARAEVARLGLVPEPAIRAGHAIRMPRAYPVYDDRYRAHVETIRAALVERCPGLHVVGRNGMHRYNNQDHAMMTAMLTVENIVRGRIDYDVWRVNVDAEYIEDGDLDDEAIGRLVPRRAA